MSLNARILSSAAIILIIFIAMTIFVLEKAYYRSTETALKEKMNSQLYALMAAAEVEQEQLIMPPQEQDALLTLPDSGVYAFIKSNNDKVLWRSTSALDILLPKTRLHLPGENTFSRIDSDQGSYHVAAYGVRWADEENNIALTFYIISDLAFFSQQLNDYRNSLWRGLGIMALLLLITQASILRWGLSPLRLVGKELTRIEQGEQQKIQHEYPQELKHLTDNINILLKQERQQKTRYQEAMGNLAHSLKTPLAVMQSHIHSNEPVILQQQVERMDQIVRYQLQRAISSGSSNLGQQVSVAETAKRILSSLDKVYIDKNITTDIKDEHHCIFKGDEADLMEILGNILDNAYKWANSRISVRCQKHEGQLTIDITDDGRGFETDNINKLLQRGARAEQNVSGQGIGLAVVSNIVDAYKGTLLITNNKTSGATIKITLP